MLLPLYHHLQNEFLVSFIMKNYQYKLYKLSIFFSPSSEAHKPGLPFRNTGITFPSQVFPIKLDLDFKVIDPKLALSCQTPREGKSSAGENTSQSQGMFLHFYQNWSILGENCILLPTIQAQRKHRLLQKQDIRDCNNNHNNDRKYCALTSHNGSYRSNEVCQLCFNSWFLSKSSNALIASPANWVT